MANVTINSLPLAVTIDATQDFLPIYTASAVATQRINRSTFLGISGSPVGTTDSQALTNKTIGNTNTLTVKDTLLTLQDDGDTTKQARFQLSGITTATTRTYTLPDVSDTFTMLAATQTLTNKTLTSPTISAPTITNATISADAVTGFSTANTGTIYGVSVTSAKINGSSLTNNSVTYTQAAAGFAVQVAKTQSGAVASGTTTIPNDDTIPQNTEGDQYMTVSITPKATSNVLIITVTAYLSLSAAGGVVGALFQDSTANALAAGGVRNTASGEYNMLVFTHTMTAGTTSATTFKFRAGGDTAGTLTFNGNAGGRKLGGVLASSIVVTEYNA